jgi:hypothetical protein
VTMASLPEEEGYIQPKGNTGGGTATCPSSIFTTALIVGLASGISCTHKNATLHILSAASLHLSSSAAETWWHSFTRATSPPRSYMVHASSGSHSGPSGASLSMFLLRPTTSNRSRPKLYTSHFSVTGPGVRTSGAMYPGVPCAPPCTAACASAQRVSSRAMPKSVSFGVRESIVEEDVGGLDVVVDDLLLVLVVEVPQPPRDGDGDGEQLVGAHRAAPVE